MFSPQEKSEFNALRSESAFAACLHFIDKGATLKMLETSWAVCSEARARSELALVLKEILGDVDFDHFYADRPSAASDAFATWNKTMRAKINVLIKSAEGKLKEFRLTEKICQQEESKKKTKKKLTIKDITIAETIQNWARLLKRVEKGINASKPLSDVKTRALFASGSHITAAGLDNICSRPLSVVSESYS